MRATAIIPVKRFRDAKRRLASMLGGKSRTALIRAMLADVLEAAGESARIERLLVVTAQPAAAALARSAGARVLDDKRDQGHSHAAMHGIRAAVRSGAECAVLLPGDCPLLDAAELDGALARSRPGRVGIVPDRHRAGTNSLILAPPDAIEPAFGEGSRKRHEEAAHAAGYTVAIERLYSLALDIDTPDDLAVLRQALARNPALAPRTAAALQRLRSRAA